MIFTRKKNKKKSPPKVTAKINPKRKSIAEGASYDRERESYLDHEEIMVGSVLDHSCSSHSGGGSDSGG